MTSPTYLSPTRMYQDLTLKDPTDVDWTSCPDLDEVHSHMQQIRSITKGDISGSISTNVDKHLAASFDLTLRDSRKQVSTQQQKLQKMNVTETGQHMMQSLADLDLCMRNLHPSQHNLNDGLISKIFGRLFPNIRPIRKYFLQYQTKQSLLRGYEAQIQESIQERHIENRMLEVDRDGLISISKVITTQLSTIKRVELELHEDVVIDEDAKVTVLHAVLQTINALSEQLIVTNQGIIAYEMLRRLNAETIRSAQRTLHVSMTALDIACTMAISLAGIDNLLSQINAIKQTTNQFITHNANMMFDTVQKVNKVSASTTIDLTVLSTAIDKINASLQAEQQQYRDNIITLQHNTKELDKINSTMQQH